MGWFCPNGGTGGADWLTFIMRASPIWSYLWGKEKNEAVKTLSKERATIQRRKEEAVISWTVTPASQYPATFPMLCHSEEVSIPTSDRPSGTEHQTFASGIFSVSPHSVLWLITIMMLQVNKTMFPLSIHSVYHLPFHSPHKHLSNFKYAVSFFKH